MCHAKALADLSDEAQYIIAEGYLCEAKSEPWNPASYKFTPVE